MPVFIILDVDIFYLYAARLKPIVRHFQSSRPFEHNFQILLSKCYLFA